MELEEIQTTPEQFDGDVQIIQNNTESIPEEPKPSFDKQTDDNCELSDGPLKETSSQV